MKRLHSLGKILLHLLYLHLAVHALRAVHRHRTDGLNILSEYRNEGAAISDELCNVSPRFGAFTSCPNYFQRLVRGTGDIFQAAKVPPEGIKRLLIPRVQALVRAFPLSACYTETRWPNRETAKQVAVIGLTCLESAYPPPAPPTVPFAEPLDGLDAVGSRRGWRADI